MLHLFSLATVLGGLWLLLSGYLEPWLLMLGAASVVATVAIAHRMDVVDHEGHPIHLTLRGLVFWPWLLKEIVKANIDCAKIILAPRSRFTTTLLEVDAEPKSELGQVVFANAITLTPGMVTLELDGGRLTVHSLDDRFTQDFLTGEMGRRCATVIGDERAVLEATADDPDRTVR